MTRFLLGSLIFSLVFFVGGALSAQAQACPGTCYQYSDPSSPSAQCPRGTVQDNRYTCSGSFDDSICCVDPNASGTAGNQGSAQSSNQCSAAFQPCTTPDNKSGYCELDDSGTGQWLCYEIGISPTGTGVSGTTGSGVGAACKPSGSTETGVCQDRNSATACQYGYRPAPQCAAPLECCITNPIPLSAQGGSGSSQGGCPAGYTGRGSICFPATTGLSAMPIALLLMRIMNWLLAIFGMLAVIAFVISGIQYLAAAGDEGMAETAKRNMQYSIIGVIVALAGLVIVKAIDMALLGSPFF